MSDNSAGDTRPEGPGTNPRTNTLGFKDFFVDMVEQKLEFILLLSRLASVVFAVLCMLGSLAGNPYSFYQKAIICNGFTSALRLHHRMPTVRLNAEFLGAVLLEDACHYLIYSLIFLFSPPISMVLLPPTLFATLHSSQFILQLLDRAGMQQSKVSEVIRTLHQNHRVKVFRLIAMTEIFLMPTVVIGLFWGRVSLMAPFMYYRFLKLRYASVRNPYTRNVFYELRLMAQQLAARPSCPAVVSRAVYWGIQFISSRAD